MTFAQPAFLWGLLAVAIPIVIHLISLRRYRKVYFSNVDRLVEMQSEQRRRSRLREWLILAARMLAIVFLVLAFAQPTLRKSTQEVRVGSTAVSIYIDNSFSMEQAGAEGSVLDMARVKAREVVAAYAPGDRFQLMTNDMTGSQMHLMNRDELLEALDAVTVSAASPALGTVVRRQQDFLRQAQVRNRHAYLFSDFQTPGADLQDLPADSTVLTTLVPLEGVAGDNIYIDTLRLDAPAYYVGGSVAVEVLLRNAGSRDVEKVPVRLAVDGRERAIATVDLPAGGSATATLLFSLEHTGYVDGIVEVEDYPITFDDKQYFSFCVTDSLRVDEVYGAAPNEYLQRLFSVDSTVRYRAMGHLQVDDADLLVLNGYDRLSSGEVQQLVQWVEQGGSLLVVPPVPDKTEGTNLLLAALQAPRLARWLPRTVKGSSLDHSAALYRNVFAVVGDDMEMPVVQGHFALANAPHQPLITLDDGTPLLCVTPVGSGRVYLFTAPLQAGQNSLVNQALFVPTLYNMALYSHPLPPPCHTLGADDPVVLHEMHDMQPQPPELTGPEGFAMIPELRKTAGRQSMLLHGGPTAAGFYMLGGEHLAFNYSRRESQMQFLTVADMEKALEGRQGYTLVRKAAKSLTDLLRARDGGTRLWRLMLVLALTMLAAEILLIKLKR